MSKSKKLVFFGNERLSSGLKETSAPTLRALISAGYEIVAVVSHHNEGRSRNARKLEVAEVAKEHGIPVFLPQKPDEILNELKSFKADAAVLVAYGVIISTKVIDVFPKGIINVHPSLLPKYRGPIPIEQAILDGADETGVSIMSLSKEMDAGPVYAQEKVALTGSESKEELTGMLAQLGADMVIKHLPAILDGSTKPKPQDSEQATYCSLLQKSDGAMDLEQKDAATLAREVRAYQGFPKSRLHYEGHDVVVLSARAASSQDDGAFVIPCANNSFLEILELIAPSGRSMRSADYLRGYQKS